MSINQIVTRPRPDEEQEPTRRPFWYVGVGLLVLVVVVLGLALFLDKQLRPMVGLEATPIPAIDTKAPTAQTVPAVFTPVASSGSQTAAQTVEQSYLAYWSTYSDALYTLDTSHLSEVMAGTELKNAQDQVDELKRQDRAAKIDIDHNYSVVTLSSDKVGIQDHYLNKSYIIDAKTKQPLQSPKDGEIAEIVCWLEKIDGVWKVTSVSQVGG
ncbi:MAG: hypothetical protein NTZ05_21300 [Chloroflexi bacterium]|nr:hypothetical protein [Chloroflexota bacterium]